MRRSMFSALAVLCTISTIASAQAVTGKDWHAYYGSYGNDHYSPLRQINTTNVTQMREAWRFDTKETGGLETTPLIIGGVMYALTPSQHVIALDGKTGRLLWTFDSGIAATGPNRGLTYWQQGKERRLIVGIMHRLYALNPVDGQPIKSFGNAGYVDLREGLGRDAATQSIALTSPPVVYRDLLIVGGRVPETLPAPPGDIRAFDVHTGKQRWIFHTIPHPGEPGHETWPAEAWKTAGAANNWAGMAIDHEHGMVYISTGSAAPDFDGSKRIGDDLYANSLVALDAATGKYRWHFQGVHHDLWDRDFPCPPTLLTVRQGKQSIPAVAVSSKQGVLFAFNRVTGKPLFPIEERPVGASIIPGEIAARTQPFPTLPLPFARQEITEETLTKRNESVHAWAVEQFHKMRHIFPYEPFRVEQETLVMPSFEGGGEWGGMAADPSHGILFINANDYASIGGLAAHEASTSGQSIYMNQCGQCHGQDRTGVPQMFPSLVEASKRLNEAQIAAVIAQGRGRMPSFPALQGDDLKRLLHYVMTGKESTEGTGEADLERYEKASDLKTDGRPRVEYTMTGYRRFLDPEGYPAVAPPWGTLSAIDLNTGKYLWHRPLGEYPALAQAGVAETGTENYGGPLLTAGGVLFIAATNFDRKFRAFDEATGKKLWEVVLPYAGNATPATYEIDGQQYVVIASGGSSLMVAKGSLGGVYLAYALPKHQ